LPPQIELQGSVTDFYYKYYNCRKYIETVQCYEHWL